MTSPIPRGTLGNFVVIGTSPFEENSVVVGAFTFREDAREAANNLESKGWSVEICVLLNEADIDPVLNTEGIEDDDED